MKVEVEKSLVLTSMAFLDNSRVCNHCLFWIVSVVFSAKMYSNTQRANMTSARVASILQSHKVNYIGIWHSPYQVHSVPIRPLAVVLIYACSVHYHV